MNDYTQPEFLKSALLTIDTQCDTLEGGPLEVPGTNDILPNMASLLTAYRSAGLLIIHIVRIYQRDGSNVDICRKQAIEDGLQVLIEGEPGCEIAPPLLPNADIRLDAAKLLAGEIQSIGDNEVIMYKPRWGAFFNTPLESYLRSKEVNSVVFTGCNFPNCPRTSIYQAGERDFKIALASDALSGLYPRGITELENIGVQVSTTEELINRLATL